MWLTSDGIAVDDLLAVVLKNINTANSVEVRYVRNVAAYRVRSNVSRSVIRMVSVGHHHIYTLYLGNTIQDRA